MKLPDPFGPLDPGEKVEEGRQKATQKQPQKEHRGLILGQSRVRTPVKKRFA
jgi:hypothetical protein